MITLSAPISYEILTSEGKTEICNGCGSKGGIPVPSTFYGLDISEACNIHDFRYYIGETWKDKEFADFEFHNNLKAIIESETSFWILKKLRLSRAKKYVLAVELWGDSAYRKGKGLKAR